MMKNALPAAGIALCFALSSTAGFATVPDLGKNLQASTESGLVLAQRKDVDEGSKAPPPSGPSSQTIACNPSSVDCP
jgi:hypothetical protein